MKIHFLNVDLEIASHHDLQPIVEAFGEDAFNLYCGQVHNHYLATFEASNLEADADSIIAYFCSLIQAFDKETKGYWNAAFTKVFDIGYESGLEPRSYSSEIRVETIKQVADLGASLRVTIYPPPSS